MFVVGKGNRSYHGTIFNCEQHADSYPEEQEKRNEEELPATDSRNVYQAGVNSNYV